MKHTQKDTDAQIQ